MRRASAVTLCAGVVSLGLHASGLVAFAPKPPQALSGGPQQLAMVGNSFEDAVAGRIAPSETATEIEPVDMAAQVFPTSPVAEATLDRVETSETPAYETRAATSPIAPAQPVAPATPAATATPRAAPVVPIAAEVTEMQPAEPDKAASPPTPERIAARPAVLAETPGEDTPRPLARAPRPDRPPEPAPPAPSGSAEQTTRTGQASGQPQGNAAQTAQGAARSSGSADFDRIVLSHMQRAVPFPVPPPGAQRSFNVTVQGR